MKNRIREDKKSEFKIEINGTRVRVKGSKFYKKMMSRNTSPKLADELKQLGLVEGLNSISVDRFMEIMKSVTSQTEFAYKKIKKAIKNGENSLEGIRTDYKMRSKIRAKLIKKGIIEDNITINKKEKENFDSLEPRTIEIKVREMKEKEEEIEW